MFADRADVGDKIWDMLGLGGGGTAFPPPKRN